MSDLSTQERLAVREAYDFAGCPWSSMWEADAGALSHALTGVPVSTAVLVDVPAVVEGARTVFDTEPLRGRCQLVGGDFLAAVPAGGDLYILKRVLVDRTDDEAHILLAEHPPCDDAAGAGARGRSG